MRSIMMKRTRHILAWLLIFAVAFIFAACGSPQPSPSPSSSPTPVETTPETTPTPTPEPSYDPTISPTTGLKYDGVYQPVAVIISNTATVRPQVNLQIADVVYEIRTANDATRFMAIFNDHLPEKAGPSRSSRVSFCDLWQEWQSIYCHWGGEGDMNGENDVALSFNTTGIKIRIDGNSGTLPNGGSSAPYSFRDGKTATVNNAYFNPKNAATLYAKDNYQPPVHRFNFDAQADLSAWQPASSITVPFGTASAITAKYVWDADKKAFLRFTVGKAHKDRVTGKQIEIKNIVVMKIPERVLGPRGMPTYWLINNVGKGAALFFRDGKYTEGTWEKTSKQDPAVFKDKSGNLIQFTPGNTWFSIVDTNNNSIAIQ